MTSAARTRGETAVRSIHRTAGLLVVIAWMLVVPARAADPDFQTLKGRWLRPDGGYVLEIRKMAADGTMDAAYLNPRPINVSRAKATRYKTTLRIFVELRAPNYPGSTYTLTYDPKRDELYGVYFQAVQGRASTSSSCGPDSRAAQSIFDSSRYMTLCRVVLTHSSISASVRKSRGSKRSQLMIWSSRFFQRL